MTRMFMLSSSFSKDDNDKNNNNNNIKNKNKILDCVVLGGGISGCTLTHNLFYHGKTANIILAEERDYLGGNVKSHVTDDGFVWEEGPNSFATQPSIVRIATELGIADQLVFANEALPPWVNHNGKLHPLPKGQGGKGMKGQLELLFGPNGIFSFVFLGDLLSWPGKIRAGIGALLGHLPPPTTNAAQKEETIREWIERTLGEEVFLRCIDPFVSGVYAGNPETLSMKAALPKIARIEDIAYSIPWNVFGAIFYGGLARQIELTKERKANPPNPEWPSFEYGNPGSFRKGLSTLPNAIVQELQDTNIIQLQWKALRIEKDDNNNNDDDENNNNNIYKVTFETPQGIQTVRTRSVVSTIPAHSMASILEPIMPESKSIFESVRQEINRIGIYYPPVAAVTVAYPKSSFRDMELPNGFGNLQTLPGFGNLNPRTEGVRTLGTLWSSSLFPDRAPSDYHLLLNYIGGSRDVSIANMTTEEIVNQVDQGCRQVLLQSTAPPPKVLGVKVWPKAIPQYELGHLSIMKELEQAEAKVPGVWVCGNYRTGVAFPDCVTYGYEHAQVVKTYLLETVSSSSTTTDAAAAAAVVVAAAAAAAAPSNDDNRSNKEETTVDNTVVVPLTTNEK